MLLPLNLLLPLLQALLLLMVIGLFAITLGIVAAPVPSGAAAGAIFPTPLGLLRLWRPSCDGAAPCC
jgi:hypothetical protein